ncbi:uncharacterized protein LOC135222976 [Macrobrachium nipponense]|uniref:uncharacterized protein LOC135222976 n=1 Tax=Macrobrachium nipponense TaxID=159736 RepID=UPI0030C8C2AD
MRLSTLVSIEAACFFLQTVLSLGLPSSSGLGAFGRTKRDKLEDVTQVLGSDSDLFIGEGTDEGSTGTPVTNPWLYRFPPWSLPHNPPPDGFASRDGDDIILNQVGDGDADGLEAPLERPQLVEDGDVVIVSDLVKSDRRGRLSNVKIPGGTLYRDQVVQTIVDLSLGKRQRGPQDAQAPVGVVIEEGGILVRGDTPEAVVQNGITIRDEAPSVIPAVRLPVGPLPAVLVAPGTVVTSRIPESQNHNGLFTPEAVDSRNLHGNIRVSSHFGNNILQPHVTTESSLHSNIRTTSRFGGNILQPHVTNGPSLNAQKPNAGEFRPSPPDLSLNNIPAQFNVISPSTFPHNGFRPRPSSSGTPSFPIHGPPSLQGPSSFPKQSRANRQFHHPFQRNSIGSGVTKHSNNQQPSTLSDFISSKNNIKNNVNINNINDRKPLWVPVVPGASTATRQRSDATSSLPLVRLQQSSFKVTTGQGKSFFPRETRSSNRRPSDSNGSPRPPTSIQDIIDSTYDTVPVPQGREREAGHDPLPLPPTGNLSQQDGRWLWRKS